MISLKSATDISAKLPELVLEAEKIAHSFMRGTHNRKKTGSGDDFWQFRKWQQGDNISEIDWRQTAKTDDVYIKQTEWQSAQSVWLYASNSKSMQFTSSKKFRTKQEYAEIILLALSSLMLDGGEKVSLLGSSLPLQLGHSSVVKIYEAMQHGRDFSLNKAVKNKSHIIVISDFFEEPEQLENFCNAMAAKNIKALFVQINDKAEELLPYKGKIKFTNISNNKDEKLIPKVEMVAEEYRNKFLGHRSKVQNLVEKNGWEFKHYTTDMKLDAVISDLYKVLSVK